MEAVAAFRVNQTQSKIANVEYWVEEARLEREAREERMRFFEQRLAEAQSAVAESKAHEDGQSAAQSAA